MARDIDVSESTISYLLRGKRALTMGLAKKFAEYWGVSLEVVGEGFEKFWKEGDGDD